MYIFPDQILFQNVLENSNVSCRGLLPESYVTAAKVDLNLVKRRQVHVGRGQAAKGFVSQGGH